ncbi:MAG TPA: PASTA domain-containing protein, partial [Acidimicrobiales bacterium]|nr:PASTA domain-containing protein [Acidimicrobiales bacterium]
SGSRPLAPDERTMAPGSATTGGSVGFRGPGGPDAGTAVGDLGDVFAVASAVGVASDRLHQAGRRPWWRLRRPSVAAARRRDRRRATWVVLAAVLAALLVGGAAYGVVAAKVFVASHPLPTVTGLTTEAASARLAPDHLTLRVTGRHSSVSVGAGRIIREIPGPGTALKEGSVVDVIVSTGPPPVTVPSLAAVTTDCAGATTVLESVGFTVSCTHQSSTTVPSGAVIDWSPKGHAPLGSTIDVVVSSGPPVVSIPSLTGSTCAGATTTLQAIGLVAQCQNAYSMTVPNGQVISWTPTGQAAEGSTVVVQISQGPPPVTVPPIDGRTVADAISMLEAAGLVPGTDQGPLGGRVFASNPSQGSVVPEGTSVTLYSR